MKRYILFVLLGGSIVFCSSCTMVNCRIEAENVEKPLSYTPCVYDSKGRVIECSEKNIIEHFKTKKRVWAILWGTVNFSGKEWDISEEMENKILKADGDAIVNMTVDSQSDWWWYISSFIPIMPNYNLIVIEGDIVSVKE